MKLAVITLNKQSIKQAQRIDLKYSADIYTVEKYATDNLIPLKGGLKNSIKDIFNNYEVIIFVMAMGIIVREIAPFLKHKSRDPAILCLSVDGRFIIPVLSGHLGGANEAAQKIGQGISAIPVITTASDILNKKAVDMIAKEYDLVITSFKDAMEITAMMINNEDVTIISEVPIDIEGVKRDTSHLKTEGVKAAVYISYRSNIILPLPYAHLIPKRLILGIGARRGTEYSAIFTLLNRILGDNNIDIRAISKIASIDLKKDETGIIKLGESLDIPFITYSSETLNSVVEGFSQSDFVKKTTGVGAVSMPSGYICSGKGECLVEKVAENGITLSLWEKKI